MRKVEVIGRIVLSCLWEATFAAFSAIQTLVWMLNGTYSRVTDSGKPENFDRSAQVLRIMGRFRFEEYFPYAKESCFLLAHVCFDSPHRVLQDHISIFRLTENEAIFVEAPSGYELWRAKHSAFYYHSQFYKSVYVIRMPISSFLRLADALPDPERLILLNCTARCGSSLLTQMFESTDELVAYAEPPITFDLANLLKKKSDIDSDHLIASTIRLLCKPTHLHERGYVVKIIPLDAHLTPRLLKSFPRAKCLFMYRDGLKVSQSLYRVLQQQMIPTAAELLSWSPTFHRWVTGYPDISTMSNKMSSLKVTNILTLSVAIWATAVDEYREFREAGLPMVAVRYEDIVADPETNMRRMLTYCGLPEHLATDACRALSDDSQRDSSLSTARLHKIPTMDYSGSVLDEIDAVCNAFSLPRFSDRSYIAPGTITSGSSDHPHQRRR